jgi:signal transduction histidine kinase
LNTYDKKYWGKVLLIIASIIIVGLSVWYAHQLAKELSKEETKNIALWANAYKNINNADENTDIGFLFQVIQNNTTVPVILTSESDSILFWRNLDSSRVMEDKNYLEAELLKMKKLQKPIEIEITDGKLNYIYYKESIPLVQLKIFPLIQLAIIGVFLIIAYIVFNNTRNEEQNRVWVGMAKETAHQLGTPISSLAAWLEYFKETKSLNPEALEELEKDVSRLEQITERFSKIGSAPVLTTQNLAETIEKNVLYIKNRASQQVVFTTNIPQEIIVKFNAHLFDWVLENLLKNALDAMNGKGMINITASQNEDHVYIDVKDSGKGIAKSKFNMVFKAGYSTKKRGWGLGLTLVKRIVEEYHKGKIYVKQSELGKGTTFRIVLKKG